MHATGAGRHTVEFTSPPCPETDKVRWWRQPKTRYYPHMKKNSMKNENNVLSHCRSDLSCNPDCVDDDDGLRIHSCSSTIYLRACFAHPVRKCFSVFVAPFQNDVILYVCGLLFWMAGRSLFYSHNRQLLKTLNDVEGLTFYQTSVAWLQLLMLSQGVENTWIQCVNVTNLLYLSLLVWSVQSCLELFCQSVVLH